MRLSENAVPLSTHEPLARLRALRCSHCHTCGCARCRRIDRLLNETGQPLDSHPEAAGTWLVEGHLLPDGQGGWALQFGETITPLRDSLSPWVGHYVMVLIGELPALRPEEA